METFDLALLYEWFMILYEKKEAKLNIEANKPHKKKTIETLTIRKHILKYKQTTKNTLKKRQT